MKFQDFVDSQKVRKGSPDIQLAKSLIKISDNHIKSLQQLEITEITSSTIMMTCYEALREIVEAVAIKEGYKVYSHEAFTFFLKEKGEELVSSKFDRFRKIRNNINYYGQSIEASSVKENKNEIEKIINELKQKFLQDLMGK